MFHNSLVAIDLYTNIRPRNHRLALMVRLYHLRQRGTALHQGAGQSKGRETQRDRLCRGLAATIRHREAVPLLVVSMARPNRWRSIFPAESRSPSALHESK